MCRWRQLTFGDGEIQDAANTSRHVSIGTDPMANVTTFAFNYGQLRSETQRPIPYGQLLRVYTADNPNQPSVEYVYDSLGRVKEARDAIALQVGDAAHGGRSAHQFLIADGTRGERIDPLGQSYIVTYDTKGRPIRFTDEMAHVTTATYDGRGRVASYTYPEGDCEQFLYDTHNNMTQMMRVSTNGACSASPSSGNKLVVTAAWDQTWNKLLWIKTPLGYQSDFTYTSAGLLWTATRPDPDGSGSLTRPVYTFTYNSHGQLATAQDPDGVVTTNSYSSDGKSNLTQTQMGPSGLSIVAQFAYDATYAQDVTRVTDPRGNVSDATYDLNRRKLTGLAHNGDASAALIAGTRTTYDAVGRVVTEDAGLTFSGSITWRTMKAFFYTRTGKPWKVTDADGAATRTLYDALDRPLTVIDPALRQVHFDYCVITDTNCAANAVRVEYRAWMGFPGACTGHEPQECYATYTYDLDDEKATVTDANGNLTDYHYDKFIRLDKTTFPDMTHENLDYDKDGFILTRSTRSGVTITYTPDQLDRLLTKAMPITGGTRTTSYTISGAGRTTAISDNVGNSNAYGYDGAFRLTSVTRGVPGLSGTQAVSYQYDAAGNRTRITWPGTGGYYVQYGFDHLNRMAAACENGAFSDTSLACTSGVTLATYAYDSLSRRTSLTYGNGASMAYIYSNAGDLTDLNHDMSGSGNDPHFTNTFTPAHQLASMTLSDTDYRWQATGTTTNTYAHNNLNQYTTIDSVTQSYDSNGNLTGNGTWTYAYDAENHMTSASATGTSASYLYDPLDHRSSKLVNSVWTFFLGDTLDDEIAEYSRVSDTDQTPVLLRRFVPGPGIDQPIAMVTAAGARTYFHTNRIGSVIAMSGDSAAKAEGPFSYDPYGFVCQGEGTSTCNLQTGGEPYKFTGRRLDPETGLYYYRARYYCWSCGRFIQTDPIGYGPDLNLYAYVGNDPLNRLDPLGLEEISVDLVLSGVTVGTDNGQFYSKIRVGLVGFGVTYDPRIRTGAIPRVQGMDGPCPVCSVRRLSWSNNETKFGITLGPFSWTPLAKDGETGVQGQTNDQTPVSSGTIPGTRWIWNWSDIGTPFDSEESGAGKPRASRGKLGVHVDLDVYREWGTTYGMPDPPPAQTQSKPQNGDAAPHPGLNSFPRSGDGCEGPRRPTFPCTPSFGG